MISEHVSAHHLSRKAVIYVRQSTPNQVLTNRVYRKTSARFGVLGAMV